MKKLMVIAAVLILAVMLIVPYAVVGQEDDLPGPQVCGFYGTVTMEGTPVPEGTVIKAWIDDIEVASTVTPCHLCNYYEYMLNIGGDYEGETIIFTISSNDLPGGSAEWVSSERSRLDLDYTAGGGPNVCGFYGTVTLNGSPVPEGTAVKAWIDGELVAQTTTSSYGGDSVYDIGVPGNYPGEIINFSVSEYVYNISAGDAVWVSGEFFNLDLAAGSQNIYVNSNVSGGDGNSWATAYDNLQDALDAAEYGDSIWVAEGTYTPTALPSFGPPATPTPPPTVGPYMTPAVDESSPLPSSGSSGDRNATFQLVNGVKMYGGFPDTGNPGLNDRNPQEFVTTLSGDIGVPGNPSDNCYHVVTSFEVDDKTVIDGFTITGGNADDGSYPSESAFADMQAAGSQLGREMMLADAFASASASGGAGYPNYVGGGMVNSGGSPDIFNCTFRGNSADFGAGLLNESAGGECKPEVLNCVFDSNAAVFMGGGIYNYDSRPYIWNCTFYGNSASDGGGIFNSESYVHIVNCILWEDTPNEIQNMDSSVYVDCCNVQGGYAEGNEEDIDADPGFVDPDGGDFHLSISSPCIDSGLYKCPTATDFEGDDRVIDGDRDGYAEVDIGADEFVPAEEVWVDDDWTGLSIGDPIAGHTFGFDAFATIQNGIYGVAAGGTVNVAGGIYEENIIWNKNISLLGSGATTCIIDGGGDGSVITTSGLGSSSILTDFTITNGLGNGGGMHNQESHLQISNCHFLNNQAPMGYPCYGGGMWNEDSSPWITDCTFTDNSAEYSSGGGMYNSGGMPVVTNCAFRGNSALYSGGAIYNMESSPTLTNCTIYGNNAVESGGGVYNNNSDPVVTNCIIWNNTAAEGSQVFNDFSSPDITYCDIQNGTGEAWFGVGCINADPLLANPGSGDFHLGNESPCINTGTNLAPDLPAEDFEGEPRIIDGVVDMGIDEIGMPRITITPAGGPICSQVVIEGYDFGLTGLEELHTSDVTIGGDALVTAGEVAAARADLDSDGQADDFSVNTAIPRMQDPGVWEIACRDLVTPGSPLARTNFDVDSRVVTVAPASGPAGTDVVVTGSGFCPGDTQGQAIFMFGNTTYSEPVTEAIIEVDNEGNFTAAGQIPLSAAEGLHGIIVYFDPDSPGTFTPVNPNFLMAQGIFAVTVPWTPVIYVDHAAAGANNGMSWDNAFTNLREAIDSAEAGQEIWVVSGTYTPALPGQPANRTDSFQMKNEVGIYGGFVGTETERSQRDWEANKTVLSGEIGNPGTITDNCYHVFYHPEGTNLDSTAILDGFTITGGNANSGYPDHSGGGMYNDSSCFPSIINCTFSGNSASNGGGMINWDSSPSLTNCTFSGNSADVGGGMCNWDYASPQLTDCTFTGNSAKWGGGMYNLGNLSPQLTDCTFSGNSAVYGGGGMANFDSSSPQLADCTFTGNSVIHNGGGMVNWGSSPQLADCAFSGNSAGSGGGGMANVDNSSPQLINCAFSGNLTLKDGGGMHNLYYAYPQVTNCTFSGNSADDDGGGMVNLDNSSPTVTNCIFSGNSAVRGGGMYNDDSSPGMTNCILWGDTALSWGNEIYNYYSSSPVVTYCDIEGGYPGTGNIDADPLWVNPGSGDFHLMPTSPCIDSGSNAAIQATGVTEDFEGDPRIISGTVDMGVDEVGWSPWAYDNNPEDGAIEYGEMIAALMDYLTSGISYSQMTQVLMQYLVS